MKGFINFIREQGIVGLAIGFILGGAISKVVTALITDIVNPILGIILGRTEGLKSAFLQVGAIKIAWGDFLSNLIDFLTIALIIYLVFKTIGIEKLDKKKIKL